MPVFSLLNSFNNFISIAPCFVYRHIFYRHKMATSNLNISAPPPLLKCWTSFGKKKR